MNSQSKELRRVYNAFPEAYINRHNEMIIYPKENTYFLLDNVSNQLELDCKVLEYCSRQASKGLDIDSREYHWEGMEEYFERDFTEEELDDIYTKLGNGINRELCIKFLQSNFDFSLLK